MSHYAKIDDTNTVIEVIVAEEDFVTALDGRWIQASYNNNLRKNFPGIGFTYDEARDAFIPPQIFNSWVLDETVCRWEAPVEYPDDGSRYDWDEDNLNWKESV